MRSKWVDWKPRSTESRGSEGFEGRHTYPGPVTTSYRERKEVQVDAGCINNGTRLPPQPLKTPETEVSEGRGQSTKCLEVPFQLVRRWAAEACVGAVGCFSNPHILHRDFSAWASVKQDAGTEDEFLEQLALLGYSRNAAGMVEGLCLAADFIVALKYEQLRRAECGGWPRAIAEVKTHR